MDDNNIAMKYWLHNMPGMGNKRIHKLLEVVPDPVAIYELGPETTLELLGIKPTVEKMEQYRSYWKEWNIEDNYKRLYLDHISFLTEDMPAYPQKLLDIPDRPYGIYIKGTFGDWNQPMVAVIGARNCSEYGKYIAREFGKQLALAGICVISGMAKGIDGITQKETIENGGRSVAVLGNGVDICYPPENRYLYDKLMEHGAVISEYAPGTQPMACLFPPRNRIISGLCDALVVIEAREKSGTLITVDMALEQGKDVYALPGRVTDQLSYGVNRLIKQGAELILSPNEFVKAFEEQFAGRMGTSNRALQGRMTDNSVDFGMQKRFCQIEQLTEREKMVFEQLGLDPIPVDKIWEKLMTLAPSNLSLSELMEVLLKLCMKGYVRQVRGGYGLSI